MFTRNLTENLKAALTNNPVVLLIGARQAGKSTLARSLSGGNYQQQYITFDDPTILAAALDNPTAF